MENHLGRKLQRHEVVHHINGDKRDNRIENLAIVLLPEHSRMHMKEINPPGTLNKKCRKLTDEQVKTVFELHRNKLSYRAIGKIFGVDKRVVKCILTGVYYKELFQLNTGS
jgi:hypothetical protein